MKKLSIEQIEKLYDKYVKCGGILSFDDYRKELEWMRENASDRKIIIEQLRWKRGSSECPVCKGKGRVKDRHFHVWLIWDVDPIKGEVNLRAIDTDKDLAERHKKSFVHQHEYYHQQHIRVDVEETIVNHAFGWRTLDAIARTKAEDICKINKVKK